MDLPIAKQNLEIFMEKIKEDEQLQYLRVFPLSTVG
jgi:hypothetical protein